MKTYIAQGQLGSPSPGYVSEGAFGGLAAGVAELGKAYLGYQKAVYEEDKNNVDTSVAAATARWTEDVTNSYLKSSNGVGVKENFTQRFNEEVEKNAGNMDERSGKYYRSQMEKVYYGLATYADKQAAGKSIDFWSNNVKSSISNLSASVMTRPDSLPDALAQAKNIVGNATSFIGSDEVAKADQAASGELVRARVYGLISKDPSNIGLAKKELSSGMYDSFLSADDKLKITDDLDRREQNNYVSAEREYRYQEVQGTKTTKASISKMMSVNDEQGRVTTSADIQRAFDTNPELFPDDSLRITAQDRMDKRNLALSKSISSPLSAIITNIGNAEVDPELITSAARGLPIVGRGDLPQVLGDIQKRIQSGDEDSIVLSSVMSSFSTGLSSGSAPEYPAAEIAKLNSGDRELYNKLTRLVPNQVPSDNGAGDWASYERMRNAANSGELHESEIVFDDDFTMVNDEGLSKIKYLANYANSEGKNLNSQRVAAVNSYKASLDSGVKSFVDKYSTQPVNTAPVVDSLAMSLVDKEKELRKKGYTDSQIAQTLYDRASKDYALSENLISSSITGLVGKYNKDTIDAISNRRVEIKSPWDALTDYFVPHFALPSDKEDPMERMDRMLNSEVKPQKGSPLTAEDIEEMDNIK